MRIAFRRILEQASWLDEHTRQGALAKLEKMGQLIAYDEWLLDDDHLDREHGFETGNGLTFEKDQFLVNWAKWIRHFNGMKF